MSSVESRAVASGYRIAAPNTSFWKVERIGPPGAGAGVRRRNPRRSRALAAWLDRLSDPTPSSEYRISRAAKTE